MLNQIMERVQQVSCGSTQHDSKLCKYIFVFLFLCQWNINKSLNLNNYISFYTLVQQKLFVVLGFFCRRDFQMRSLLVCLHLLIWIIIVIMWVHFLFTFLDQCFPTSHQSRASLDRFMSWICILYWNEKADWQLNLLVSFKPITSPHATGSPTC